MTTKRILRYVSLLSIVVATTGSGPAEPDMWYDLVILHGRVIDPESGLDAERNVAIHNGSIVAVTTAAIKGKRSIDGTGLVVAPGFIDIHSHAQQLPGARMQAFDGVTTALELELGMLPIDRYYEETAHEGRPINFGASASWVQARQAVMDGAKLVPSIKAFQDAAHLPNWSSRIASEKEISSMSALMEEAIGQGALGIGFNVGYSPPSGRREYYMLNKLAAAHDVPTFTHVRFASTEEPHSSFEAYEEMVAVAASTGAHMHISHFNSTALRDVPKIVELVRGAQERGVPLTVEAYPYSAASTVVGAAMFRGPDWQKRLGAYATRISSMPERDSMRQVSSIFRVLILERSLSTNTCDLITRPMTSVCSISRSFIPAVRSHRTRCLGWSMGALSQAIFGRCRRMPSLIRAVRGLSRASFANTAGNESW